MIGGINSRTCQGGNGKVKKPPIVPVPERGGANSHEKKKKKVGEKRGQENSIREGGKAPPESQKRKKFYGKKGAINPSTRTSGEKFEGQKKGV